MDLSTTDKISCRGLAYDCEIGFHDCEHAVKQKILVDFDAFIASVAYDQTDSPEKINIDYFVANRLIEKYFSKKSPKLLETAANDLARLLLGEFNILAIQIKIIKHPLDMPNTREVSYTCFREKSAA